MKMRIAILFLLGISIHSWALGISGARAAPLTMRNNGILQSIRNGVVIEAGEDLLVTRTDAHASIELVFVNCQGIGIRYQENQWWVLPLSTSGADVEVNKALWILPGDATSEDRSWHISLHDGSLHAKKTDAGLTVTVDAGSMSLSRSEARPHSDPFGNRFSFDVAGGAQLEQALAAFYWGTMLPSVVEKTMAANFPYSSGYVLSTLNVNSYAGSYPAVDHEFQIKGRLAIGSEVDLDVVKRMIELQFKLMNDDPERLYRAPTSVQPNGSREYHVRRSSEDNRQNAAMFPLTGDIEVIEEAWGYYCARKDEAWLRSNIENLEHAAEWILSNTDQYGRVWSDVYYEDQVMKDGRETQAQAFAARAFQLLASMESLLERPEKAAAFNANSRAMAGALTAALPQGYWDARNQRFVDWVDRNGDSHDHLPLLANELPVTFGWATPDQAAAVRRLIDENFAEFERFPSFVAARIADYDKSEIGNGGPYDLCAAGRYWYWDAAYYASQRKDATLSDQLQAVAGEAAKDNYFMAERYDMDHVYYIDGKSAHGAQKYYEYPNVFTSVLIEKYLGLSASADADVAVTPRLKSYGSVEFHVPRYALRYSFTKDGFVLKNLSDKTRRYKVSLAALGISAHYRLKSQALDQIVDTDSTVMLRAQEEAHWTSVH